MKPLYRIFNLSSEEAAEVLATIVEILKQRADDERVVKILRERFSGDKLNFADADFREIDRNRSRAER